MTIKRGLYVCESCGLAPCPHKWRILHFYQGGYGYMTEMICSLCQEWKVVEAEGSQQ